MDFRRRISLILIAAAVMVLMLMPVCAHAESGISQVSAGEFHSTLVQGDGTMWGWGLNDVGQLAIDKAAYGYHLVGAPFVSTDGVKEISAGDYHTAIIKNDGTLWTCGDNACGQLGIGKVDHEVHDKPVQVEGMDQVLTVSAGYMYTAIVKNDGSLWMCGRNYYGQFGIGTSGAYDEYYPTPVKVMDSGVAQVSIGQYHSAVLKDDGTLWMCGRNDEGQLGTGGPEGNVTTPVEIEFKDDLGNKLKVKSVSAGGTHTAVITEDGALWTFGDNGFGQLGDGTTTDRRTPVKVADGVKKAVASGMDVTVTSENTAVLKEDNSLWMCGCNTSGQLGNGEYGFEHRTNPDLVKVMDGVADFAPGYCHMIAVKADGTLWAWGQNEHGEVGTGTIEGLVTEPTEIALEKAVNPMTIKGKTIKIKYSKLKKKSQTYKVSKAITVSKAKGTKTYKLKSVKESKFKKYFKINAKTGKLTVKKGLNKGKYKVTVTVTADGGIAYRKKTLSKTFTVKVVK